MNCERSLQELPARGNMSILYRLEAFLAWLNEGREVKVTGGGEL
jgi:hypothetical protein